MVEALPNQPTTTTPSQTDTSADMYETPLLFSRFTTDETARQLVTLGMRPPLQLQLWGTGS